MNHFTPRVRSLKIVIHVFLFAICSLPAFTATIHWANPSGGAWEIPANWDLNRLPTNGDNVIIDVPGQITVTFDMDQDVAISSLQCQESLTLSTSWWLNNSFTVFGSSQVTGRLQLDGVTFIASGSGASFSAPESADVGTAYFSARNGAVITLAALTNYSAMNLEATGLNSQLSAPALRNASGRLAATDGAFLNLTAVQSFAPYTALTLDSGSINSLTSLTNVDYCYFSISGGSQFGWPSSVRSLQNASISLSAGVLNNFSAVTNVHGTVFFLSQGSTLSLASITSWVGGGGSAIGANTSLNLPALLSGFSVQLIASLGGAITMPVVNQFTNGSISLDGGSFGPLNNLTNLNYTGITSSQGSTFAWPPQARSIRNCSIYVAGGSISGFSVLTNMYGCGIYVSQNSTLNWPATVKSFYGGTLELEMGTIPGVGVLTNLDFSTIYNYSGTALSFPLVTDYAGGFTSSFYASGLGSILSFPALRSMDGGGLEADYSGQILLPTTFRSVSNSYIYVEGFSVITNLNSVTNIADTAISVVNNATLSLTSVRSLPGVSLDLEGNIALTGITNIDGASLSIRNGSTLVLPLVRGYRSSAINNSYLSATGEGSLLAFNGLTSLEVISYGLSAQAYNGGSIQFTQLTNIVATNGYFSVGASPTNSSVNFPALQKVTNNVTFNSADGGLINIPLLHTFTHSAMNVANETITNLFALTNIDASSFRADYGATFSLPGVTTGSGEQEGAPVVFESMHGSWFGLPALQNLILGNVNAYSEGMVAFSSLFKCFNDGSLVASGGSVTNLGSLTNLDGVSVSASYLSSLSLPAVRTLRRGGIQVNGGSINFSLLVDVDGSALGAEGGSSLALPALKSYRGGSMHAAGLGSLLDLSQLKQLVCSNGLYIYASGGAEVRLSGVTNFVSSHDSAVIYSSDAGSMVDMASVPSIDATALHASSSGNISLAGAKLFNNSTIDLAGGAVNLSSVTNSDNCSFYAYAGSTLTLPFLKQSQNFNISAFDNGTVSMPLLKQLTQTYINASHGGAVLLPALTQLSLGNIYMMDAGTGLDLSSISTFIDPMRNSSLLVTNGAALTLNSSGFLFSGVDMSLSGAVDLQTNTSVMGLYGTPWRGYQIEMRPTESTGSWSVFKRMPLMQKSQSVGPAAVEGTEYRVFEINGEPPVVDLTPAGPGTAGLVLYGLTNATYRIETSLGLESNTWTLGAPITMTNAFRILPPVNTTASKTFYRARKL